jgi:enamine deaminase RidA (YjgF/YER057c/UK114 family)
VPGEAPAGEANNQMARQNISSGTPWEALAGYSRAVRVGAHVHVAGTTASDEAGNAVGEDTYAQAKYALEKIGRALEQAGARLEDVVRTRVYVSDIANWEGAARAHGEVFGKIRPANTLVEARLVAGRLVEIEAEAIVGAGDPAAGGPAGAGLGD